MSLSISLVALALSAMPQVPEGGPKAEAIAPFVGEEVAIVAHLDLARWEVPGSSRRVLGKLADDPDLAGVIGLVDGRAAALKKAGVTGLFVLVDPADMPGFPVVVVPMAAGADARAVADLLKGERPGSSIHWPAAETIRGAVVAGTPEALARIRGLKPGHRPELAAALDSVGNAPIRIAIIPSIAQRRAIEESFPILPPRVGGGPIEGVSRGMTWASIAMATEPRPTLYFHVQGKDAASAAGLLKVARDALKLLDESARAHPSTAELADAVARMKPELNGETFRLEADLDKTASLVSVPVRRLREAGRRSECVNNLKQIGLAMHNYLSQHKTFPAAFVADKDGRPLLSWRVAILPFLEEKELYDQFHLDEPWDGPHNRPLIGRMPRVFACPSGGKAIAAEGKTTYLTPRGPASLFPGAVGVKIADVKDGTSNTILVVDAGDDLAVTWTRPEDWVVAPEFTTRGLFGHHALGTNFGLADGSVRFLKETITPKTLRAMTTYNGGEVIDLE